MPLLQVLGRLAVRGIISKAVQKLAEKGVTTELAKAIAKSPEAQEALAKVANRRIRRLREANKLEDSEAYKKLEKEYLVPLKRKTISGDPLAGEKGGKRKNKGATSNVLSTLKFLNYDTSTLRGIKRVQANHRRNYTNQLLKYSTLTDEEKDNLRAYLDSLSDKKFNEIAAVYKPLLETLQYSLGSREAFNLIGTHLMEKYSDAIKGQTNKAARNIYKAMLTEIKGGVNKSIENSDPSYSTLEDVAKDMGIDRDIKTSVINTAGRATKNIFVEELIKKAGKKSL